MRVHACDSVAERGDLGPPHPEHSILMAGHAQPRIAVSSVSFQESSGQFKAAAAALQIYLDSHLHMFELDKICVDL